MLVNFLSYFLHLFLEPLVAPLGLLLLEPGGAVSATTGPGGAPGRARLAVRGLRPALGLHVWMREVRRIC